MHQLSPYIGKLKSTIAGDLVERFSRKSDLVVDPFSGAGTIPFEACLRGRRALGADISPYAKILSRAKLSAPRSLTAALNSAKKALTEATDVAAPDLRTVPKWVRRFFHPETLHEALKFACVCRRPGNEFLMACFLGILHHQRPGFLSYPSSHLVPYLRNKKFPRDEFPEMYSYRDLESRFFAKVERSYKRFEQRPKVGFARFEQTAVESLCMPPNVDALITSPPYMNALDYGRDNRLRLWFIDPSLALDSNTDITQRRQAFISAITSLASKVEVGLKRYGHCVFVVGEEFKRSYDAHPSEAVVDIMQQQAPSLSLRQIISDQIPDIRRARRECKGIKTENILVFQKI
jgi:hypothetical protein